jgi:hypothetical protein
MKHVVKSKDAKAKQSTVAVKGPSLFEVEYLRQLKEEMEIFLRSRNFPTIKEFDIAFAGSEYTGHMRVSA